MPVTVEEAQAWCNEAKRLMELRRGKTQYLVDAVDNAKKLVARGKPEEISDKEWKKLTDALTEAETSLPDKKALERAGRMAKRDGHDDSFGKKALLEGVSGVLDDTIKKVPTRKKALSDLKALERPDDAVKLSTALDPRGEKQLAELDDPAKAFGEVKVLVARLEEAKGELPDLTDYVDASDTAPIISECEAEIRGLDLVDAQSDLERLERIVNDAKEFKDNVGKLKIWLKKQKNKEEPTTEGDWIKLFEKTKAYAALRNDFPEAVKYAREHPTKAQQLADLEPRIDKALKEWPALTVADRLSDHDGEYKLAWIANRVERLWAPPPDSEDDKKKKKEANEWKSFVDEVVAGWTAFADSGYSPQLRGVDMSSALRTPYVTNRLATLTTLKIGGKTYTKSSSDSAGVSLKTPYPRPTNGYPTNSLGQLIVSFIYHL